MWCKNNLAHIHTNSILKVGTLQVLSVGGHFVAAHKLLQHPAPELFALKLKFHDSPAPARRNRFRNISIWPLRTDLEIQAHTRPSASHWCTVNTTFLLIDTEEL